MVKYFPFSALFFVFLLWVSAGALESRMPMDIPFQKEIQAKDLKVDRLTVEKLGTYFRFNLYYRTGRERCLSFFDPPKGDKLSYFDQRGLRKEATNMFFIINGSGFTNAGDITLRFSERDSDENDRNFIFLTLSSNIRALPARASMWPSSTRAWLRSSTPSTATGS